MAAPQGSINRDPLLKVFIEREDFVSLLVGIPFVSPSYRSLQGATANIEPV